MVEAASLAWPDLQQDAKAEAKPVVTPKKEEVAQNTTLTASSILPEVIAKKEDPPSEPSLIDSFG